MSSSIEQDLFYLIEKYDLTKFSEKFINEGITSCKHVKDIDQTRLRSYYNMLEVDLRNFEKLRNECIKFCEQSDTPMLIAPPRSLGTSVITPPGSLGTFMITPPRTLDSLYISHSASGTFDLRAIHESMPRLVGDAPNSIQDGAYLLDYDTDKAVGEFKMKGITPCIQTFPNQVIIQNETLICDLHSQNPVCELKVKNRIPYVIQVANKKNVRPNVPLYDGALVDGHKGLGIIIAYNHMEEDIENRTAIRDAFTMLFQKMNLHIVYLNDKNKTNFTLTLFAEINKAVKVLMKTFFIGIFSHRQDQDGAKVQLQDGDLIGLNEIFQILKDRIPTELPKVIIIQACQSGLDTKMRTEYHLDMNKPYNASIMESNYLVVYSNARSYKNPEQSLWYIQTLIRAYNEMQDRSDFYHVLVCANQLMLMGKSSPDAHKKPAQIESTLSKHLYV